MPAVLVETGFMSNRTEGRKLAQPAYQNRIAAAMEAKLRQAYGTWSKGTMPKEEKIEFQPAKPGYYLIPKEDVNQSSINMVGLGIRRSVRPAQLPPPDGLQHALGDLGELEPHDLPVRRDREGLGLPARRDRMSVSQARSPFSKCGRAMPSPLAR